MKKKRIIKTKKESSVKEDFKVDKALTENFVSLQKVMTNMVIKLDSLSQQISSLLELFEISAKSMAEKGYSEEDKRVIDKIDNLIEQNKIIARGITLLHEKNSEPEVPVQNNVQQYIPPAPIPSNREFQNFQQQYPQQPSIMGREIIPNQQEFQKTKRMM